MPTDKKVKRDVRVKHPNHVTHRLLKEGVHVQTLHSTPEFAKAHALEFGLTIQETEE